MMKRKHTQDERDYASHQKKEQWARAREYAGLLGISNLDAYANISLLDRMKKEGVRIDRSVLKNPGWVEHKETIKRRGKHALGLGNAGEEIAGMDLGGIEVGKSKHHEFYMTEPSALKRMIQRESKTETVIETINLDPLTQDDLVNLSDVRKVLEIIRMCGSEESTLRVIALALKMLEANDE